MSKIGCTDPLVSCSGVIFLRGDTDERSDGRRYQALDGRAQVSGSVWPDVACTAIFQLKGWQVCKRPLGQRPRFKAKYPRQSCLINAGRTDLCRVRGGKDGWLSLALVIDCSTRQLLGWHLSRTGRASTASRKTEARSHQGGYCSNCGKPTNLANFDAHHVQRHADGGASKPENMAVVCKDCHMDLHGADK